MSGKARMVVLGGGFGGLETAFYLRMRLREQADITLVSDRDYFLFKPNTTYIPFGLDPDRLKLSLPNSARRAGMAFLRAPVREVDPEKKEVSADGQVLKYDFLVIATGAGMRPQPVPC